MHWGPTVPPSWPAFSHTQLAISRTAGQTRQQSSMRPACLLVGLAVAMVAVDAPVYATKPCGLLTLRGRALAASGDGRKRARWKLNPEMRFMRPGGWEHLKKRGQKEAVARLLDPDPTGAIVYCGRQPWLLISSGLLRFPCHFMSVVPWCLHSGVGARQRQSRPPDRQPTRGSGGAHPGGRRRTRPSRRCVNMLAACLCGGQLLRFGHGKLLRQPFMRQA